MKKSWMVLSLLLLIMPTFVMAMKMKFYGGLAGGIAYYSADNSEISYNQTIISGSVNNTDVAVAEANTNHFSGVGQAQLGAGISTEHFYLGLEALGQLSNAEYDSFDVGFNFTALDQNTPTSFQTSVTKLSMNDFEPAVDLKPGIFLVPNTLLYGRVGIAFNEITLENTAHFDLINSAATENVTVSKTESVNALRLGLGIEHAIYNKFTVFADYTYTMYDSIVFSRSNVLTTTFFNLDFIFLPTSEIKASDINKQTAMLGVNYYF